MTVLRIFWFCFMTTVIASEAVFVWNKTNYSFFVIFLEATAQKEDKTNICFVAPGNFLFSALDACCIVKKKNLFAADSAFYSLSPHEIIVMDHNGCKKYTNYRDICSFEYVSN